MNVGDILRRIAAAPRALNGDQQLAGLAALALLVSMFLPWYEKNTVRGSRFIGDAVSAFGTLSFVEAAIFLVSAGVLALLFTRAEGREYELPGGDGTVILAGGAWAALLLFWRVFDRPDVGGEASTVGIQWGFFVAFLAAGGLAAAGWRLRQHERDARPAPPTSRRAARAARAGGGADRPAAGRRDAGPPVLDGSIPSVAMPATEPSTIEDVREGLQGAGYLAGESAALVAYLATRLGKPVLVEGPAGVGKTELAKALSRYLDRTLVRLQCYEGLDEAKALYEWNYRKQLLRIQAEAQGTGWNEVQDDIFGEEFLLTRPLLQAISSEEPVVLLIDEIDKTDQEFEAMLLEILSDFQVSIPELGRVEARSRPVVLLTSNNTRELTEALKRRCLYLWLDYPDVEHELEIVRLHAPELDATVARKLVEVIGMVRDLDLKKPPSIAESIDWARALLLLGATDIDDAVFRDTMSVIVKHRTDLDLVAERVGVKLVTRA